MPDSKGLKARLESVIRVRKEAKVSQVEYRAIKVMSGLKAMMVLAVKGLKGLKGMTVLACKATKAVLEQPEVRACKGSEVRACKGKSEMLEVKVSKGHRRLVRRGKLVFKGVRGRAKSERKDLKVMTVLEVKDSKEMSAILVRKDSKALVHRVISDRKETKEASELVIRVLRANRDCPVVLKVSKDRKVSKAKQVSVFKAHRETKVMKVKQVSVFKAHREMLVLKAVVFRALKVRKVTLAKMVFKDHRVCKGRLKQGYKDFRGIKVRRVQVKQEPKDRRDYRGQAKQEFKARRASKAKTERTELKVLKVFKALQRLEHKVLREMMVHKEIKDYRALASKATSVHKGTLDYRAPKVK